MCLWEGRATTSPNIEANDNPKANTKINFMAWNPSPKVADCREIARKWNKQQVIIIAIDTHADTIEYASYGETKQLCAEAKNIADAAFIAAQQRLQIEAQANEMVKELFRQRE